MKQVVVQPLWLLRGRKLLERAQRRVDNRRIGQTGTTVLVVAATLYTVWLGRPDAALTPGAPPRSDLGGHIVALQHLIEVSLPSGHLLDWSHQWFAGYPSFYFYFPLPALLIAGLSILAPIDVVAKLVAVAAPALMPAATYRFVRASGFDRATAAAAVLSAVAFISMTSQYIFGGNVLSSVIGEYSYAIGFAFALAYLSLVARAARGRGHTVLMALTLAATALSHLIPLIFAVAASVTAFPRRDARKHVLWSWIIAFGLTAFWTVPFVLRSSYMGHIAWLRHTSFLALFPLPILMVLPWSLAAIPALRGQLEKLRLLLALAAVALVSYFVPHALFAPGRALPLWHFVVYVGTGIGVAVGLHKAWQAQQRVQLTLWVAGLVMLIGASVIQLELVRKRSLELLSTDAPDYWSYAKLRWRLAELPPGRIQWEYRRTEEELIGARLPLAQLPSELPAMRTTQGLLVESSLVSPAYTFAFANVAWDSMNNRYWRLPGRNDRNSERMQARLRQLGIDYFVTTSKRGTQWARSAPAAFEPLGIDTAWSIWRVRGSSLIEPLTIRPRLFERSAWRAEVSNWLEATSDTTPWPVVARGDARAKLSGAPLAHSDTPIKSALAHRTVWFSTKAIGTPHIVRVSYFPNWRAYGADGPYLAVPGFMIVIPRQQTVLLRFETTWVERTGTAVTLMTIIVITAFPLLKRRKRMDSSHAAQHA